jgi:GMP synthase-like glutamine amidotransferase
MRVTVIENTKVSHLGQVGVALAEAGARVEVVPAYAGAALPPAPDARDAPDALVVLGGEQNARDDRMHPYLPHLAALMRAYGEAGRAVLGICLGSQILARGCGAANIIGGATEFGWHEVRLTAEGRTDPVLSAAGDAFPIFQWHDDTFTAPPGSVHLAASPVAAQQAFRFGRAAYGMQFHFEASRDVVADWIAGWEGAIRAATPGWIERHPEYERAHGAASDAAGLALARAWVRLIDA